MPASKTKALKNTAKKWSEDSHPRDTSGKFTHGSGGTLHTAESLKTHGIAMLHRIADTIGVAPHKRGDRRKKGDVAAAILAHPNNARLSQEDLKKKSHAELKQYTTFYGLNPGKTRYAHEQAILAHQDKIATAKKPEVSSDSLHTHESLQGHKLAALKKIAQKMGIEKVGDGRKREHWQNAIVDHPSNQNKPPIQGDLKGAMDELKEAVTRQAKRKQKENTDSTAKKATSKKSSKAEIKQEMETAVKTTSKKK